MSEHFENSENIPLAKSAKTCAELPETYRPKQNISILEDTTNHLFPILRRRKVMAIGVSLLCFGACLFAIENIRPLYHASAQLSYNGQNKSYIETQLRYLKVAPITLSRSLDGSDNQKNNKGMYFKPLTLENIKSFSTKTPQDTGSISPDRMQLSHIPGSNIVVVHYYDHNAQNSALKLNSFLNDYIAHINTQQTHTEKTQPPLTNNPQYIAAKTNYLALKAQLSAFISKDGSININGNKQAQERLRSNTLDELQENMRKQTYTLETLSSRYGEKHPKMIAARKALTTISAQIKLERETLLGRLIDNYITAKTTFDALERIYNEAPENSADKISSTPIVQLIEPAQEPQEPVSPEKPRLIGLSLLLSLFLGVLIPVIVERRRKTFICGQQLSHSFGLLCYALIPRVEGEQHRNIADYVLDNPSDTLVEAIRSLRLNIKLKSHSDEQEDKIVLVTSSKEGEGKSMLCTWLARLAAKSGERVLLIDANLRDPSIHQILNGKNALSLVEYLTGKAPLDKVIDKTDPSGLHAIYGRSIPNSVLDLLSSHKMGDLMHDIREDYDLIIIDTPPCLTSADARALSPHADLLLYLVSWNKTKRDVIHKGLSQFLSFARIRTALVLSNIDVKKHIEYGYGEVISNEES
jgi:capsular exopolysaccharide synthesis family protein